MSDELPLPKSRKVKAFRLSALTCAALADLLEQPPAQNLREPSKLKRLRAILGNADAIKRLRMCGEADALHWHAHMRTAALVACAPAVRLTIGAGIPATIGGTHYTPAAARLAARNGITLHHLGRYAFTVLKSPPPRKTSHQMKPSNLLSQVRRSGMATRRALKRCQVATVNGYSGRKAQPQRRKAA